MLKNDTLNKEIIPLFDTIDWKLHVETFEDIIKSQKLDIR